MGIEAFNEQNRYIDSAAIAAYSALNPIYQQKKYRSKISLKATDNETFNLAQGSSSSGLGYSLALFLNWWRFVLDKNIKYDFEIFATGEISSSGELFEIAFLNEKIQSIFRYVEAHDVKNFLLCYPSANDAAIDSKVKEKIEQLGGRVLCANSIHGILEKIIGEQYDGDTENRWEPFKGLNSYSANDSVRFFFREETVGKIIKDIEIEENPLLYLGSRQSGKTSVVNAGLLPILDDEWKILNITSYETLSDVYFEIIKIVGEFDDKIKKLDKNALVSSELSLKFKDIVQITERALKSFESFIGPRQPILIVIDDFHLIFNTDNKLFKEQFISMLQMVSKRGIKIVAFSNKEYIAYFEDKLLKDADFELHFINDFSVKDIEKNLIKQVLWAGYKFETVNGVNLASVIVDDVAQYDIGINIVNLLLKRLYEVATIEKTKTFRFEHYERIGKFPRVFSEFILEQTSQNGLDKTFINRVFETFYDDSIKYSMNHTNSFELDTMLKLGFLKYHPLRGHFSAQKLLFLSPFYQSWLDHNYISWYEIIRGQYIEWRTLFDREVAFDDSVLLNAKQNEKMQNFRKDYTNAYRVEKKIDTEIAIGSAYAQSNLNIDIKDLIKGRNLIDKKIIFDEKMKLFIQLSHRKFLVKTATRFTYLILILWAFYA